jgi:hypothetical protein
MALISTRMTMFITRFTSTFLCHSDFSSSIIITMATADVNRWDRNLFDHSTSFGNQVTPGRAYSPMPHSRFDSPPSTRCTVGKSSREGNPPVWKHGVGILMSNFSKNLQAACERDVESPAIQSSSFDIHIPAFLTREHKLKRHDPLALR